MEQLKDILPKTVEGLKISKQYKAKQALFHWNEIVGNSIAAQSIPLDIEYGTLFIYVKNSVWCHHLMMMKADIIFKFNQFAGEPLIRDIQFRNNYRAIDNQIVLEQEQEDNLGQNLRKIRLSPEELQHVEEITAEIKEEELKKSIKRLYRKQLAFTKYKEQHKYHPCAKCGSLCPNESQYCWFCALEIKQERHRAIRQILASAPWSSYAEVHAYISCSSQEYIDAKITLINLYAGKIVNMKEYQPDDMNLSILTMLFTGAKFDVLSDKLRKKTFAKFRRRQYVSASRV